MGACASRPGAEDHCRNAGRRRVRHHLHHHHHSHASRRGGSRERSGKKYLAPATQHSPHLLSSEPTQFSAPPGAAANGQLQHQGSSRLTAGSEGGQGQRTPQGPPYFGRRSSNFPRDVGGSQRERGGEGDFDDYLSCNEDQFSVDGTPCMTGTASPLNRQVSQNVHSPSYHDAEYTSQPSSQKDKDDPVLGRLVGCLPILGALNLAHQSSHRETRHYSDSECSESECGSDGPRPTAKPDAGCSLRPFKQPDGSDLGPEATECYSDAGIYSVRGVDYPRTRTKVPGAPHLYSVAAADVFGFPCKRLNIAPSVNLPQPSPKCIASAKAAGLPPMIVFNISLPIYPAPIFGPYDGKCLSIVTYAHFPEDFDAEAFPNKPALGLIRRLVENGKEADGTMTRDRLKLVPRCANPEEWAQRGPLSQAEQALLTSYNEKPILTRPQQAFFPGENYLEIDFDVHQYTYLARRAITTYMSRLKPVIWETAFIVQGNHPEELPEQVLAATRIYRLDFESVPPFSKFCEDAAAQQLKQQASRLSIPSLPAPSNTQVLPDSSATPADAPSAARQAHAAAAESLAHRHSGTHKVPAPPPSKEPSPTPAPSTKQPPTSTPSPKESPSHVTSAPLPPKAPGGPASLHTPPHKSASGREEGQKAGQKASLAKRAHTMGSESASAAAEQQHGGAAAKRSGAAKDARGAAAAAPTATSAAAGKKRASSPGATPSPTQQQQQQQQQQPQRGLPKSRSARSRESPSLAPTPSPPARSATSHSPPAVSPVSLSPSPSGAKRGSHSPHAGQPPAAAAAATAAASTAGKPPKAAANPAGAKAAPISPPSPPSECAASSAAASPASHFSHMSHMSASYHSLPHAPPPAADSAAAAASPSGSEPGPRRHGKRAAAKAAVQNGWSRARGKKGSRGHEKEHNQPANTSVQQAAQKGAPTAHTPPRTASPPPRSPTAAASPASPSTAAAASPTGAHPAQQHHPATNGPLPAAASQQQQGKAAQPQPSARSPTAAASAAAAAAAAAARSPAPPHRSLSGPRTAKQQGAAGGKGEGASKQQQQQQHGREPWLEANGHEAKTAMQQVRVPGAPQHSVKVQQ